MKRIDHDEASLSRQETVSLLAYLPELGADLVAALSGLDVNDFSHLVDLISKLRKRGKDRIGSSVTQLKKLQQGRAVKMRERVMRVELATRSCGC